jgi:protein-tyrosine phosphatase
MNGENRARIIEIISEKIKTGNVLVHCEDCHTHAPTVAILWLKHQYGLTTNDAFEIVKQSNLPRSTNISIFVLKYL